MSRREVIECVDTFMPCMQFAALWRDVQIDLDRCLLGSEAWGIVLSDAERQKCVHVFRLQNRLGHIAYRL